MRRGVWKVCWFLARRTFPSGKTGENSFVGCHLRSCAVVSITFTTEQTRARAHTHTHTQTHTHTHSRMRAQTHIYTYKYTRVHKTHAQLERNQFITVQNLNQLRKGLSFLNVNNAKLNQYESHRNNVSQRHFKFHSNPLITLSGSTFFQVGLKVCQGLYSWHQNVKRQRDRKRGRERGVGGDL